MRELQEFKDCHKGADIYIVASGKSMDFYDPSFLDGKITIGINQVYRKFRTTQLVRKETELLPEILRTVNGNTTHFISEGNCGDASNKLNRQVVNDMFKGNVPNNIVIFKHLPNLHRIPALPEREDQLLVSHSTITSGIHLAAYMGAKNIILMGHDCGTIDGNLNFDGYHTERSFNIAGGGARGYSQRLSLFNNDTINLRTLIKQKQGANMVSLNPWINFSLEGHTFVKSS